MILDGREGGEHNGVSFVEMSEIFTMQAAFLFETEPFDSIYVYPE